MAAYSVSYRKVIKALDTYSIRTGFRELGSDVSILDPSSPSDFIISRQEWDSALTFVLDASKRVLGEEWARFHTLGFLEDFGKDRKQARMNIARMRTITEEYGVDE